MNGRQNVLPIHSHQDRPAQPAKFSKPSGLGVSSHHLNMSVHMFFLNKPRHTGRARQR
jgi:hypothetical protein